MFKFYSNLSFWKNQGNIKQQFFSPKTKIEKDIIVVGAGCIGQGVAASLLKSNIKNRIFLIPSPRHIHQIEKEGICVRGAIKNQFTPNERFIVKSNLNKESIEKYQISEKPHVFLATKARDVISSLTSIQDLLFSHNPGIVCLQNGLGTEKDVRLATSSFKVTVLKGHVTSAIHQKGNSIFAYQGEIIVEKDKFFSEKLEYAFGPKDSSIFNLKISSNILQSIYPKIALNCACNPLSVIFNENLGALGDNYENLIRVICHEVYIIASAQGIYFDSSNNLADIVLKMMKKYSEHYSSMYYDNSSGKKTEIDQINGALVQISYEKGITIPVNQFLTKSIKEIEEKRTTCISKEEFYEKYNSYLVDLRNRLLSYESFTDTQRAMIQAKA